jgi:hypothetical protein
VTDSLIESDWDFSAMLEPLRARVAEQLAEKANTSSGLVFKVRGTDVLADGPEAMDREYGATPWSPGVWG